MVKRFLYALFLVPLFADAGLISMSGARGAAPSGGGGANLPATFNVACSGNITSALQSAINSAADGNGIKIGAGSCTATSVNWSNKNIAVWGQGIGVTTVSGLEFSVTDDTKASFRITGMSVPSPTGDWHIDAGSRTTGIKGWRIDHIAFSYPSCNQNITITVQGITWGLVDHTTFTNAGNAVYLSGYAEGSDEVVPSIDGDPGLGGNNWLLPIDWGTDNAVVEENNTYTLANSCFEGTGDHYYGARSIFRYNTVTNSYWQNHAARHYERGGNLRAEIYNNSFNAIDSNWTRAVHIRSGTAVVFNNRLTGFFVEMNVDNQRSNGAATDSPFGACDGSSMFDGNTGAGAEAGYPCLDQIGRASGRNPITQKPQTLDPLYVWNNGSGAGCNTGGTCTGAIVMTGDGDPHVQVGRDYINNGTTAKPGYTPLAYPHHLIADGLFHD